MFQVAWVDPLVPEKGFNYIYLSPADYMKVCMPIYCIKIRVIYRQLPVVERMLQSLHSLLKMKENHVIELPILLVIMCTSYYNFTS